MNNQRVNFLRNLSMEKIMGAATAIQTVVDNLGEIKNVLDEIHSEVMDMEQPAATREQESQPQNPMVEIKKQMFDEAVAFVKSKNEKFGISMSQEKVESIAKKLSDKTFDEVFGDAANDFVAELLGVESEVVKSFPVTPAEFFKAIFEVDSNEDEVVKKKYQVPGNCDHDCANCIPKDEAEAELEEEVVKEENKKLKLQSPDNCDHDCENCDPISHLISKIIGGAFSKQEPKRKRTVMEIVEASGLSSDKKIVVQKLLDDLATAGEVRITKNSSWMILSNEEITNLFHELKKNNHFSMKFIWVCDDCQEDFVVYGNEPNQNCPKCHSEDTYLRDVILYTL